MKHTTLPQAQEMIITALAECEQQGLNVGTLKLLGFVGYTGDITTFQSMSLAQALEKYVRPSGVPIGYYYAYMALLSTQYTPDEKPMSLLDLQLNIYALIRECLEKNIDPATVQLIGFVMYGDDVTVVKSITLAQDNGEPYIRVNVA